MLNGEASVSIDGETVNLNSVSSGNLGQVTRGGNDFSLNDLRAGKSLNLVNGDLSVAQEVLSVARTGIARQRGELGAFTKNTVQSHLNSLGVTRENIAAAQSLIRDLDFGDESSNFSRLQVLM